MVLLILLFVIVLGTVALLSLQAWVEQHSKTRIYGSIDETPPMPVAVVFGAGYWPSGRLSSALADRMETAIDLYNSGKVNKLLLTGDNRVVDYNEPAAMAEYAKARGVPSKDLVLDYAGRRTYDSCYRAKEIFGVTQAILVTQRFHLPRAIWTCEHLDLQVVGTVADQHRYVRAPWYRLREVLALSRAWLDVYLLKPVPVLGEPIPVDWNERTGAGP